MAERKRIVNVLDLRPGDVILDAGCGPGLWLSLFREAIGCSGRIVGYDLNYHYLQHALRMGSGLQDQRTSYVLGDFTEIPFKSESFDCVFSCNSLLYHPAPLDLLRSLHGLVRPGGKIAIVHFDDAMTCYHPIEPALTLRVLTATAEALQDTSLGPYDNYLGRKLHSLFFEADFNDVETSIHPIHRHAPLDVHLVKHITGIARWQARVGACYLDDRSRRAWLAYFDPMSPSFILEAKEFSFCTLEFLTIGTRPTTGTSYQEVTNGRAG